MCVFFFSFLFGSVSFSLCFYRKQKLNVCFISFDSLHFSSFLIVFLLFFFRFIFFFTPEKYSTKIFRHSKGTTRIKKKKKNQKRRRRRKDQRNVGNIISPILYNLLYVLYDALSPFCIAYTIKVKITTENK